MSKGWSCSPPALTRVVEVKHDSEICAVAVNCLISNKECRD